MSVSFGKMIDFYGGKSEEQCKNTLSFLEYKEDNNYYTKPTKDNYIGMIEDYKKCDDTYKNKGFLDYLEKNTDYFDCIFSKCNELIKQPSVKIKGREINSQKYHLFVAYFAFQLWNEIKSNYEENIVSDFKQKKYDSRNVQHCPELWLWLNEAAGIDIEQTVNGIKEYLIKEYPPKDNRGVETNGNIDSEILKKLKNELPWGNIEKKING